MPSESLHIASLVCIYLGLVLSIICWLRWVWVSPSPIRETAINISLLICSLSAIFVVVEICFFVWPQSDGWIFTKSGSRWGYKYWGERNKLGYRDKEHSKNDLEQDKVIVVLGDSFVAGWGIEQRKDRFSDLLQADLPKGWRVVLAAKLNWDTRDEYRALKSFPVAPDAVILSYNLNDIFGASKEKGIIPPKSIPKVSPLIQPFIHASYSINYVYWRWYRFSNYLPDLSGYYDTVLKNAEIWQLHTAELHKLIAYTRQINAPLLVVVFPLLQRVSESRKYTDKAMAFFEEEGVDALNLADFLDRENPRSLIVNSFDAHPSKKTHRIVARAILEAMQGLLNKTENTKPKETVVRDTAQ